MKNKSLIVTITVVTALSLGILTGCGAYQQANADPLTNPTQIEQTIEIEDETETQESTESTQESKDSSTQETSTEQQELQNQDADPTEQTHNDNDNEPATETTDSKPSTEQAHTHTWVTETRYRTVHHDAEYKTVHHDAVTHIVHHDAVTHTETQTTYTTETQVIHHEGCYRCRDCGASFTTWEACADHCDENEHLSGYSGSDGYDEYVDVQVPHTETVTIVDQAAWDETVVDKEAYDEKVLVHDAYDEQVPYTVEVCSDCHQEKGK